MGEWEGRDIQTLEKIKAFRAEIQEIDRQLTELEQHGGKLDENINLAEATGGLDIETNSALHAQLTEKRAKLVMKLEKII